MKRLIVGLLAVYLMCTGVRADDSSLRAMLHLDAYGRSVQVKINGIVTPVKGGASENYQLLASTSPDRSKLPEDLRGSLCIKSGTNTVELTYAAKEGEHAWKMECSISPIVPIAGGKLKVSPKHIFEQVISAEDKKGIITGAFVLDHTEKE